MKGKINTTALALWASRCIALILAALAVALPKILDWYSHVRALSSSERTAITVAFYICAVIVASATPATPILRAATKYMSSAMLTTVATSR